jgi:hypothetical protein
VSIQSVAAFAPFGVRLGPIIVHRWGLICRGWDWWGVAGGITDSTAKRSTDIANSCRIVRVGRCVPHFTF